MYRLDWPEFVDYSFMQLSCYFDFRICDWVDWSGNGL